MNARDTANIVYYVVLMLSVLTIFGLLAWSIISTELRNRRRDREFDESIKQINKYGLELLEQVSKPEQQPPEEK